LAIRVCPFGSLAPKDLNVLTFQYFAFQRTWWRLFQKCVVCTKFDIYVFIAVIWMEGTVHISKNNL